MPYLNARPLLEGLEYPITELVPAKLCDGFQEGMFDAALLSSIDVISRNNAEVVDGISISSRGDVHSVILVYEGELKSLLQICLDPSSHTSNALLQIVLGEFYGLKPIYVQFQETTLPVLPRLLIGDPAIEFRKKARSSAIKILDLGEEWYRFTQLPFVFALWILNNDFTQKKLLSHSLRKSKNRGLANLQKIVLGTPDPEFSLRYLSQNIRYDLGDEEKRGLSLFMDLLLKYKLVNSFANEIVYF